MDEKHEKKTKEVLFSYFKALGIVLGLILGSLLVSYFFNKNLKIDIEKTIIIRLISAVFIAIALFGRLGWNIQTWSGTTSPEKLNNNIYKCLYGIGFFLLALSVFL